MSNSLRIVTQYKNKGYALRAEVSAVDDVNPVPLSVFVWTKQPDGTPGVYQTLAYADELAAIPEYSAENPVTVFGVRQVRLPYAEKIFTTQEELDRGVAVMKDSFKALISQLEVGSIPKEEIYVV